MNGCDVEKIGDVVFLVFADGMVAVDEIASIRIAGDGTASICIKNSGWVVLKLKKGE